MISVSTSFSTVQPAPFRSRLIPAPRASNRYSCVVIKSVHSGNVSLVEAQARMAPDYCRKI